MMQVGIQHMDTKNLTLLNDVLRPNPAWIRHLNKVASVDTETIPLLIVWKVAV